MNCSSTIDFTTALARLLCDGARRDLFRANPANTARELNVRAEDQAAFLALSPEELEVQAEVLLRKRLDQIKALGPITCARLGTGLWPRFREYARDHWTASEQQDALAFCEHLFKIDAETVSRSEWNRLRFIASPARIHIRFVRDLRVGNRERSGIQILQRRNGSRVSERWFYLAFG